MARAPILAALETNTQEVGEWTKGMGMAEQPLSAALSTKEHGWMTRHMGVFCYTDVNQQCPGCHEIGRADVRDLYLADLSILTAHRLEHRLATPSDSPLGCP